MLYILIDYLGFLNCLFGGEFSMVAFISLTSLHQNLTSQHNYLISGGRNMLPYFCTHMETSPLTGEVLQISTYARPFLLEISKDL